MLRGRAWGQGAGRSGAGPSHGLLSPLPTRRYAGLPAPKPSADLIKGLIAQLEALRKKIDKASDKLEANDLVKEARLIQLVTEVWRDARLP